MLWYSLAAPRLDASYEYPSHIFCVEIVSGYPLLSEAIVEYREHHENIPI